MTNSPVDNYILSYDAATGGFTWVQSTSGADGLGPDGDRGDITVGGGGTTLQIDIGAVGTSEINNNSVQEVDLEVTNAPSDNNLLSYDLSTGGFTWVSHLDYVSVFGDSMSGDLDMGANIRALSDNLYQIGNADNGFERLYANRIYLDGLGAQEDWRFSVSDADGNLYFSVDDNADNSYQFQYSFDASGIPTNNNDVVTKEYLESNGFVETSGSGFSGLIFEGETNGTNYTVGSQSWRWTRQGSLVFFEITMAQISGTAPTGSVQIDVSGTTMPTNNSQTNNWYNVGYANWHTPLYDLMAFWNGPNFIHFCEKTAATSVATCSSQAQNADFGGTTSFTISGWNYTSD